MLAKCPQDKIPQREREVYRDCTLTNYSVSQEAYDEMKEGEHYKISQDALRNPELKIEPYKHHAHRFSFIAKAK